MHCLFALLRSTLLLCFLLCGPSAWALTATELALVVNVADPASVETAAYYRQQRDIPAANVIEVNFPHERGALSREEFERMYADVSAKLAPGIKAFALAWTRPWRAGCMSITSAFAFGYDESFCSSTCGPTHPSAYFNNGISVPADAAKARPAMMLAGHSVAEVKALIDRGIAADFSYPKGSAYLVRTEDSARNVRAQHFDSTREQIRGLAVEVLPVAAATDKQDVIAYFTGAVRVPYLASLKFLPGAPADHLTSVGGQLLDSPQMSALEWLSAGATGSYGTVVEPCNHLGKFPFPGVMLSFYAEGDTLIEAYWKSVAWPGEGVFVGEPLARPFGTRTVREADGWWVESYSAAGRRAMVEVAPSIVGPYRRVGMTQLPPGYAKQKLHILSAGAVRIR